MLKDIYLEGLRFEYKDGLVKIHNAEGSHNHIQSYSVMLNTQQDFETEVTYWLRQWKLI